MKFNRLSPYLLTDNQENTFTLKPINCYNGECAIELKVNGKKITNTEMPGIGQIKISREHLQAVSMKGMIHKLAVARFRRISSDFVGESITSTADSRHCI